MATPVVDYIESLEKKVERLEKELKEAKEAITTVKSDDFSVLYKNTINDVYENFKRNNDIYQVDTTSENEGGLKFSLVQWSPKGTKIEDFKMLILDIRLLQTKDDIRVRVSVRVKVPDVNPTLLKNHKDTSKFEVTIPRKEFIKLSSGTDGEEVLNLVTKLTINDPVVLRYSPNINVLSAYLNAIFRRFSDVEIKNKPFLFDDSDYFKFLLYFHRGFSKTYSRGNLKGHGVIITANERIELELLDERPLCDYL